MKNRILITIVIVVSFVCCKKSEKELEKESLEIIIETVPVNDFTKWIIILPGMGCHGCIQEGEAFMKDNVNNKDILFVLTKTESLKILQNKLEIKLKEHTNIYIDSKESFNFIYPCIVHLENGKIKSHEFQSPGNNAFEKLKNRLLLAEE